MHTTRWAKDRKPRPAQPRPARGPRDPRPALAEIAAFVALPWDDAMLRPHERAAGRLTELTDVRRADGALVPASRRRAIHAHTLRPPGTAQVGRWRAELTAAELREVE